MAKLNMSAPWYVYYNELCALFKEDIEVHIVYDEMDQIINIYVENQAKADAMDEMLPKVMTFGSIDLEINVVPANNLSARRSRGSILKDLFYGNTICEDIVTIEGVFTNPLTYVIFRKEVVQYYNDDLGDAHGVCSTLYQDIAKRIFKEMPDVYYCTSVGAKVEMATSDYKICACELAF